MSANENDFSFYGSALEPLDEDNVPRKKAFTIEDQIATDDQGRRRFHGAFTGGFSAGFFNTVGSLEGWKPSEFKSSRSEKAVQNQKNPEDFMDDEDMGQFGIAPQLVRATDEFSTAAKRTRPMHGNGIIPGVPVLQSLLQPANETVGVKLLKRMGWKPNQVIGERVRKKEKPKKKVYGCEMPTQRRDISDSSSEEEIEFVPESNVFVHKRRVNNSGMGYKGLDKNILASHVNLFDQKEFRIRERNNKLVSISGTAFGVGAFEQEDEDIYSKDDMTKYDFELEAHSKKKKPEKQKALMNTNIIDGFVMARVSSVKKVNIPLPVLPSNYIPKHGVRISRFEAVKEPPESRFSASKGRHDLTSKIRSDIINFRDKNDIDNKFTKPELDIPEVPKTMPSTSQILLLKAKASEEKSKINNKNPADREVVTDVLNQDELIFNKFVPELNTDEQTKFKFFSASVYEHGSEELNQAAKNNQFGKLTRKVFDWKPHSILCKRFNVEEPLVSDIVPVKKSKPKSLTLSYYEAYIQNKTINKASATAQEETKDENQAPAPTNTNELPVTTSEPVQEKPEEHTSAAPTKCDDIPATSVEKPSPNLEAKSVPNPTDVINTAEKIDLFKAIFLSDSEEEEEKVEVIDKSEEMKKIVLEDIAPPKKIVAPKGIFSDMNFSTLFTNRMNPQEKADKPADVNKSIDVNKVEEPKADLYGPALPSVSVKDVSLDKKNIISCDTSDDDWIEIDKASKSHKKHKKISKDKKKSKHKHKKDKKKRR